MTYREFLHRFDEWVFRELLNVSTYRGCLRALGVSIVTMYVLWHTHDFYAWCRWVFDIPYEIDRGKQSWARLWALIIGGSGVFTSILSMAMLAINRHRARKSAIGQWYDRPDLTAKDLYGTASDAGGGNEETVGRGGDGRD